MNSYFFKMTNEEKSNILDQHKEVYDGYVTQYTKPNQQPLYTQDFANDKQGITVNNKGEVTTYKNMGINEMKHDGKTTGLFTDEEEDYNEMVEYVTPKSYDSSLEMEEQLDMIGDGEDDLSHGTFGDDGWEGDPYDYMKDGGFMDDDFMEIDTDDSDEIVFDIDSILGMDDDFDFIEEEKDEIVSKINESLDMFKRLKKYN